MNKYRYTLEDGMLVIRMKPTTPQEFDAKYGDRGGFIVLKEFKDNLASLKEIALHFKVSRERVRQWMVELFGEEYDPREARRNKVVQQMVDSIVSIGLEGTKKKYPSKGHYIKLALKRPLNDII